MNGFESYPPPPSLKPSRSRWLILGGAGLGVLCLAFTGLCILGLAPSVVMMATERENIAAVIDDFMQAMSDRDVDTAYDLLSTRGRRHVTRANLTEMTEGANYALFASYERAEMQSVNVTFAANSDPDMPQGQIANVNGSLSYADGYTGRFEAVLEREDDVWRVFSIHVSVPPDKIRAHRALARRAP